MVEEEEEEEEEGGGVTVVALVEAVSSVDTAKRNGVEDRALVIVEPFLSWNGVVGVVVVVDR